jgi:NitT/TauT family transport system permease protein
MRVISPPRPRRLRRHLGRLGYLVVVSLNATLDAPQLFAVIFLLAVLGCLLYVIVNGAKRFVIPWHESVLAADKP